MNMQMSELMMSSPHNFPFIWYTEITKISYFSYENVRFAIVHFIVFIFGGFPSIFQKVQHSHSRHQKTTSNLPRINLKGILQFNEIWPQEGAMYITIVEFSGASLKC